MQFRLIYKGRLRSSSTGQHRTDEKHDIRKKMHKQLILLYSQHHALRDRPAAGTKTFLAALADSFERFGFRFLPLVNGRQSLVCSLDILFLRREDPGNLITSGGGGDVDRRITTLLDALRVPKNCDELPHDAKPSADENPFYCLLEDDALVTELRVETDRLLEPMKQEDGTWTHGENDVLLIIGVSVRATRLTVDTMDFMA